MNDAERLEALEIKVSHLERGLQELSDAVVRQQQDLDKALLRNEQLLRQLSAMDGRAEPGDPAAEVPPHY